MATTFSSNEVLDNIDNNDPTVEVTGYIDKIIAPAQTTGPKNLKFILNNNLGRRIQVITWNENIEEVEKLITAVNLIVHVNGAVAHVPKPEHKVFNQGNLPYELIIQDSTIITIKGMYREMKPNFEINYLPLKDCATKIGSVIKLKGYMSCTFRQVFGKNSAFYVASMTDGYYKLELRSKINVSNDEIAIGKYIEIKGLLETQQNGPMHLKVNESNDLKILKGSKMSFEKILLGYHNII